MAFFNFKKQSRTAHVTEEQKKQDTQSAEPKEEKTVEVLSEEDAQTVSEENTEKVVSEEKTQETEEAVSPEDKNTESPKTITDDEIMAERQNLLDCQRELRNERQRSEQLTLQIRELKEQLRTFREEKSVQNKDAQQPEQPSAQEVNKELSELLKTLNENMGKEHIALVEQQKELSRKLDEKEEKYDKLVRNVQEDRYRKDKVKILGRTIRSRNNIVDVLEYYRNEKMEGADSAAARYLEEQLEALVVGLDADLKQEMVYKIQNGTEGSDFDDEHQEAVGVEPTDKPELAGKVCRSVAPGFYWTLPYIFKPRVNETGEEINSYKFIISYEQVITFQYKKA